ncbi:hypothetical protein [Halomarina litorea]|uniref:hypothetical protein n=1 Tax=Halomarina litorea TaxID=2961595 RepID=UPI0020C31C8F|nr:hypothetical protein [Halomarina sp. BCD28]
MSAARESESEPDATAASVADRCRDSEFVRLLATPDGDALAATGLLADALASHGVAFHASVTRHPDPTTEADLTVTVGHAGGDCSVAPPLSITAHATAEQLDAAPDPVLALAGAVAAGDIPGTHADVLEAAGIESAPGLGVPTDDVAEGLAHTTFAHAAFSGDPEAAASALAGVDRDGRTLASLLALAAVESDEAPPRAAEAVERALGAHPLDGPFTTLEGYADVLDAVARERPGTGVALVLGTPETYREAALDAWRDHAVAAHAAVRDATLARHDGCVVAHVDAAPGALETAARLLRDFRSPEPVVLAVEAREDESADDGDTGDDESTTHVACAADRDVSTLAREAATAVGGTAVARGERATARVDASETDAFVAAVRGAL